MKPLNPFVYLKSNFKTVLPVFLSLAAGVFFIYIFAIFSATTDKMIQVASFDVVEKYNIVYTEDNNVLPHSFLEQIKSVAGSDPIAVQMNLSGLAYYRGGMGGTTMLTINMFEDDVPAILNSYKIRLVSGRLPKNNNFEIIIPIEYALQNNLSVGDPIGTAVSDEYSLQGDYRICGLTESDVVFAVSCQPGNKTKEETMSQGILYQVDNLSSAERKKIIDSLPDNVISLTYGYYEQEYATTLNSMKSLTYIITAVMAVILCIALGNLNAISFANRQDELIILYFIGYTKGNLSRKLWMENVLVCMSGYLTGIVLTQVIVGVINAIILSPQGKELELISLNGMFAALSLPVLVSIFSLLPYTISGFKKIETEC